MAQLNELPINIESLLHRQTVESSRVEFKAGWDEHTAPAIVRTVSAFANDLLNVNGGYVVIGVEEQGGVPLLPPRGLADADLDGIQRKLFERCKQITPEYMPRLYPTVVGGRRILVVHAPAGDTRPYLAPSKNQGGKSCYWVRLEGVTAEASGDHLRQLMEQTARVPFDARRHFTARLEDLSEGRIRQYLSDIRSELGRIDPPPAMEELCRRMELLVPLNGHQAVRNVALLLFSEDPGKFFQGAHIDVVEFGDDGGGDMIRENSFRGPLPLQLRSALDFLSGLGGSMLKKVPGTPEVDRTVAYPYNALEEAIANAVYHRGYDEPGEPTKIYLYPNRVEVISYPGPVQGLRQDHFQADRIPPPVPARNRRIGEFLKELRLCESRGTGVPKIRRTMSENGSPPPSFDFDTSYFRVTLPVHPRYLLLHALRESAHLWATGARGQAVSHLERACAESPGAGALVSQLLEYAFNMSEDARAMEAFSRFEQATQRSDAHRPYLTLARLLLDRSSPQESRRILERMPPATDYDEIVEAGLLKKRGGLFQDAHGLLTSAYSLRQNDPKLLHELAQTKMKLAGSARSRERFGKDTAKRLNLEAEELLHRALQMADSDVRTGWLWLDVARVRNWLGKPQDQVEEAYLRAKTHLPSEERFDKWYKDWKAKGRN